MPNKQVIEKWADALESGQFEQAENCLRTSPTDNYFCCLGVLSELFRLETGQGEWKQRHDGKRGIDVTVFELDGVEEKDYLHPKVVQWAGLGDKDPVIGKCYGEYYDEEGEPYDMIASRAFDMMTASQANDTRQEDFATIAGRVRATFLEVTRE
jgi:hypothetical protein